MKPPHPSTPSGTEEQLLRHRVKAEIRRQMRALRRALPKAARARRSAAIAARVIARPEFEASQTVLAFTATRAEVDPTPIVEAARDAGKKIALPRVEPETSSLALHRWEPDDVLEESGFGIPEPLPSAPRIERDQVDFVIVPALAVDERGHRIGYGKGFYDRLLPTLRSAVRCALAYDFQLLTEIPNTPGDEPVHLVVTDARVLEPGLDERDPSS